MEKSVLEERILSPELRGLVVTPETAAGFIKSGMTLAFSGFASGGYPKLVPQAIARLGTARGLTVLAGASTGPELDGELSAAGLMSRRAPFQSDKRLREKINSGAVSYCDLHLSQTPGYIRSGVFGEIDCAVIECVMIEEDGGIVPTVSVGASESIVSAAREIVLEINTAYPVSLRGIHDIYTGLPGEIIPLTGVLDRVGSCGIPCDKSKIKAIVINGDAGAAAAFHAPDGTSAKIAANIVDFLKKELEAGRFGNRLPPLQSGLGNVANAVLSGLRDGGFTGLRMYTEVVQDTALDLIRDGVIEGASTTALCLSAEKRRELFRDIEFYKKHIVLRPQRLSNSPELISRLGLVAMNTAIEADIYGNVNSTHISGSAMMNGIGGSGDFARNAALTIFMTPSTAKDGRISGIVPMVSHVDSTEHDVHVIVTEHGLADLRGKSPRERAELIIENCAAPEYRSELREYFERVKQASPSQHTPHDLREALSWHTRYLETGTMQK